MNADYTDFIHNAIRRDSLCDAKSTYGIVACVKYNIAELIIMARHPTTIEIRIALRTVLSAGDMIYVHAGTNALECGCG